jgi:hypothetical protein
MDKKRLDLIVEVGSPAINSKHTLWPRDKQLFKWTNKVLPGDLIGASDMYGEWFEAVAEHVSSSSMEVHFKGWAKKFNETIEKKDYHTRLAPLYTKTVNWRAALKKGSEVDYTNEVCDEGSKWFPGIVTGVDDTFDTVVVKYKQHGNTVKQETDIALDSEQVNDIHTLKVIKS